jgi:hypothetical protein
MSATPRPLVNATDVDVDAATEHPPGFQTRYRQLGPVLGGDQLGGTVYELDPGECNGPYHYEIGNEECLLVLAGTPTLRHPAASTSRPCSRSTAWPRCGLPLTLRGAPPGVQLRYAWALAVNLGSSTSAALQTGSTNGRFPRHHAGAVAVAAPTPHRHRALAERL